MRRLVPEIRGETEGGEPCALPPGFEDFVRAHHKRMLGLARHRLGDSHDAEEATQDAFLIAYRKWDTLLSAQNPIALFYRILQNCLTDQYRRRARLARREQLTADLPETEDPQALTLETPFAITEAIDQLPTRQREVITLKYLLGWENHEIAVMLDISHPTVSLHAKRARQRLRDCLGL
ncbi:RNA polymerase sigma-70 factor, ECF subfamily [Streptomyces sp. 2323.1]|uniref:RNA polymerase sigma factor n=1 Tax=Streptomyces sp. 2323.1 TaxID=1938841 RepID=UPI000BC08FF0|nr:sigma-70 family RNA polymerase sigma factor [Streptomyces sp. 2323.1]SOE09630.1 RNA polymerase sigma-70 factor, ECF subfamily [Streptomyces sp. 2323.1]